MAYDQVDVMLNALACNLHEKKSGELLITPNVPPDVARMLQTRLEQKFQQLFGQPPRQVSITVSAQGTVIDYAAPSDGEANGASGIAEIL